MESGNNGMMRSRIQPATSGEGVLSYATRRNKSLLGMGSWLFVVISVSLLLPLTIRNTQQFTLLYVFLSLFYTLMALLTTRMFPKQAFPAIMLLIIQVWMTIVFFIVQPQTITEQSLGRHLYWPILLCLPYFVLSSICLIDPSYRERALKVLFWVCLISAVVGVGQFLRIPGFTVIQSFYSPKTFAQDFFGNTPNEYRAVGLTLHPYILASQCLFCMALIGSNLLERKLKTSEIFLLALFAAALFMAQSRSFYLGGALLMLAIMYLLFKRDKPLFVYVLSFFIVASFLLVGVFSSRLEYGIRGPNIVQSGRVSRWEAATQVVQEFPITGIGPNMTIFGNRGTTTLSDRRGLEYPENGYRMIAATAGIPGLALLLTTIVGSLFISARILLKTYTEGLQRRMAFVCFFYVIAIAIGLMISNLVEQEMMTFLGMCAAAVAYPPTVSHFKGVRQGLKLGYGFRNSATTQPTEA